MYKSNQIKEQKKKSPNEQVIHPAFTDYFFEPRLSKEISFFKQV